MAKITTVRAALQAIVSEGMSTRGLFQLGSAMGPANLYLAGVEGAAGFEPVRRTDSAGRNWLMAFTAPRTSHRVSPEEPHVRYQEMTGASLLRLASRNGSCLLLEANLPLECRIPPLATQSLQVAAGYTEALFTRVAAAVARPARPATAPLPAPRGRELVAS